MDQRLGPLCSCGQMLCQPEYDPYCPKSEWFCGERGANNYATADGSSSSGGLDLVAEYDARAARTRARIRRELQEGESGPASPNTKPTAESVAQAPPVSPSTAVKVPSKRTLAKRRREQINRESAPTWLVESRDEMDAQVRAWRDEPDET